MPFMLLAQCRRKTGHWPEQGDSMAAAKYLTLFLPIFQHRQSIKKTMNDLRKPIDGLATGLMLLLSLTWGFQQISLKGVEHDLSPILQIALRSGIAALLIASLVLWHREKIDFKNTWLPGLGAGLLFAFEFLVLGEGLRYTLASHMVVFLYTAPIWVALSLHFLVHAERLNRIQWLGILLAFAGILVTFLGRGDQTAVANAPNILLGDLLGLAAGAAWGFTTVLVRSSRLSVTPAKQTLLYQLVVCFVILMVASVVTGQARINPTPAVMASLAFQGLLVSFASFLTWFWLLRRYPASQLGVFSFMAPMFGVVFGVWLLNDPMEQSFVLGAVLVLTGIVLVNGHQRLRKWFVKDVPAN
jgi:drug/metabolite transporter (DMT)-like permease